MAKKNMICPFTGKLCRDCAIYRGRHYYLCFSKKYRGYLGEPGGDNSSNNSDTSEAERVIQIQVPVKMSSAIDPFISPLPDIKEQDMFV